MTQGKPAGGDPQGDAELHEPPEGHIDKWDPLGDGSLFWNPAFAKIFEPPPQEGAGGNPPAPDPPPPAPTREAPPAPAGAGAEPSAPPAPPPTQVGDEGDVGDPVGGAAAPTGLDALVVRMEQQLAQSTAQGAQTAALLQSALGTISALTDRLAQGAAPATPPTPPPPSPLLEGIASRLDMEPGQLVDVLKSVAKQELDSQAAAQESAAKALQAQRDAVVTAMTQEDPSFSPEVLDTFLAKDIMARTVFQATWAVDPVVATRAAWKLADATAPGTTPAQAPAAGDGEPATRAPVAGARAAGAAGGRQQAPPPATAQQSHEERLERLRKQAEGLSDEHPLSMKWAVERVFGAPLEQLAPQPRQRVVKRG